MDSKKQIRRLYILEFVSNLSIHDAVSIVLLLSRGFTLLDFGIAEGIFHITSFLCEVPSGMFADILGRKKVLALSQFFFFASSISMVFSKTLFGVCISYALTALGYNMMSGTKEALLYDSLQEAGSKSNYLTINSNLQILFQIAMALSSLCAGLSLELGLVISYLFKAGISLSSIFIALSLREPAVSQNRLGKLSISAVSGALKTQAITSFQFLVNVPRAAKIMFTAGVLGCIRVLVSFYVQELLSSSGASGTVIGLCMICISLGSMVGARLARWFEKHFALATTAVVTIVLSALGIALSAATGHIALIIAGVLIVSLFEMVMYLTTDTALNNMFSSDKRATLISTSSMVHSLYMLPLSPISGYIAHRYSLSTVFYGFSGVLLLVAAGVYTLHKLHQKKTAPR